MLASEAAVGRRVRSLVAFSGVPLGTEGVIDEDYGSGVTVTWDLPNRPLSAGWPPLRDRFDKEHELLLLEALP